MPYHKGKNMKSVLYVGSPHTILIDKVLEYLNWNYCDKIEAYATGNLATSELERGEILIDGQSVTSSKSDIVLILFKDKLKKIIGVSVKQCNSKTPTNAQIFFSTATAFYHLINNNGMKLSDKALRAMRQFCGDLGFRPSDDFDCSNRIATPERYFWKEIDARGKAEWENLFKNHQDDVTRLLLQKAYLDDPFPPEIILHKTQKASSFKSQEIAVFTIDQLVKLSKKYSSFTCSLYRVKKGRYKEPEEISHQAPKFGECSCCYRVHIIAS